MPPKTNTETPLPDPHISAPGTPTLSCRNKTTPPAAFFFSTLSISLPTTTTHGQVLYLRYNSDLTGSTPSSICTLPALRVIDVRFTGMEGSIPSCLGACTNLATIDYTYTTLSGTIPAGLCALEKLQYLVFQMTGGLTGTIPDCLGEKQPKLASVDLQGNKLEGIIPGEHKNELTQ